MSNFAQTLPRQADAAIQPARLEHCLSWLLGAVAIFALFYQLGGAALFEPDEGRNAEKARQILVLPNWLTPHENFQPVLDKPIAFYWLIALSYKLFGVSEWAARLPSALAALGCVALVYYFARIHWGHTEALWSGLILLTSLEFFTLARLVIFEMSLTFLLTLSLSAFYGASHTDDHRRRQMLCLIMYGALGGATLIKGLIGIVVPGMVIFFYLALTRKWSILRRIELVPGVFLILAVVLPWYLQMGARHEGYLRYFFWDEHFGRFTSDAFNRTQPWYYFILVGLIGFFPWTLIWPFMVAGCRRWARDDKTLFLLLWAGLPFLFLSASNSKLPHYILPIFPALAILTASRLVTLFQQSVPRAQTALSLTRIAYGSVVLFFLIGYWQPVILPKALVRGVTAMSWSLFIYGAVILALSLLFSVKRISWHLHCQSHGYLVQTVIMFSFLIFGAQSIVAASTGRSARAVSDLALPLIKPETQVVLYGHYLAGLGFYLRIVKPVWVVTHSHKRRTFLGNYYALGRRPRPRTRWGKVLFDTAEFSDQWRLSQQPLLVLVKAKHRLLLEAKLGTPTRKLAGIDDYVLVTQP